MVQHVVLWKVKEGVNKQEAFTHMKVLLEGLVGRVPGLLAAHVSHGFAGYDVVLVSMFENEEALEGYQQHPDHLKAKEFVHSVVCDRAFCDAHM